MMKRWDLQKQFEEMNPGFHPDSVEIAPDGDMLLTDEQVKGFQVTKYITFSHFFFPCSF